MRRGRTALAIAVAGAIASAAPATAASRAQRLVVDANGGVLRDAAGHRLGDRQDAAALAADVPAFVQSVQDTVGAERELALAADVFGATRCA
jgi:hypothetical protein